MLRLVSRRRWSTQRSPAVTRTFLSHPKTTTQWPQQMGRATPASTGIQFVRTFASSAPSPPPVGEQDKPKADLKPPVGKTPVAQVDKDGDDENDEDDEDFYKNAQASPMYTRLVESQFIWSPFTRIAMNFFSKPFELYFAWRRRGSTTKEIASMYGFEEDDILEATKGAYNKVIDIFLKGEPTFKAKHGDILEPVLARFLDTQLEWYNRKSMKPVYNGGAVRAELLFIDRFVRSSDIKQDSKEDTLSDSDVGLSLYATVMLECEESLDWAPPSTSETYTKKVEVRTTKHIMVFTTPMPTNIQLGEEADHADFKLFALL